MDQRPILGYWGIKGLAQPIRILLKYLGVDYEDKVYKSRKEWSQDPNPLLKHPFRNLPYYIDNNHITFESDAIYHFISIKQNREDLLGTDLISKTAVATWSSIIKDFREFFFGLIFDPENFDKNKEKSLITLQEWFDSFEIVLGGNQFLTGNKITYVDFILWEIIDEISKFNEATLEKCPRLKSLHLRINQLPELVEYFQSQENNKYKFYGPPSVFR